MSNRGYTHSHAHGNGNGQARAGAEYSYTNGLAHQSSHEDLKRTNSAASQRQRPLPPPPQSSSSRALAEVPQVPQKEVSEHKQDESALTGQKRGQKSPVDWDNFFGGKPPAEIIMIHDDDSPAPPAEVQRLPPPTNDATTTHHVDKRRRTNAGSGDATYSNTNTPYSQSHGASTDSLQATTAPTSHGSQVSSSSKLDGVQTGQKRKRTAAKAPEPDRKKQELERTGGRGYLAEYGDYVPPSKIPKKQKDIAVPSIYDVRFTIDEKVEHWLTSVQRYKTNEPVDDEDGHYIVQENSKLGERYSLIQLLGQGTFGKVVKALDIRTRKEVAVKIIRAVPKVRN